MANPYHHSLSSVKRWGGTVEDYLPIHHWFDESKAHHADFRHRALRHHTEGIFLMETIFGNTITLSTCARCGKTADEHVLTTGTDPAAIEAAQDDPNEHEFTIKTIPSRWVGEQHVQEDLGRIPAATDWLRQIEPLPWMNRARRLSRELEREAANA
jgi:hypothetical protein